MTLKYVVACDVPGCGNRWETNTRKARAEAFVVGWIQASNAIELGVIAKDVDLCRDHAGELHLKMQEHLDHADRLQKLLTKGGDT